MRKHWGEMPDLDRRTAPVVALLGCSLWAAQLANVFFLHDFATYLAAPLWFLGFSAFQFTRLLLTPGEPELGS